MTVIPAGQVTTPDWQTHAFRLGWALDLLLSKNPRSPVLDAYYRQTAEKALAEFWLAHSAYFDSLPDTRYAKCEVCGRENWLREEKVADSQIEDTLWACPQCPGGFK